VSKSLFEKYYTGFVRAPLFWVSALLCLGITLGAKFDSLRLYLGMMLALIPAALVSFIISARKKIPRMQNLAFGLLCATVVAFGAFYYRVWLPPRDENIAAPAKDVPARIKVRAVKTSELKPNYSRVLCNLSWIDSGRGPRPARGRLWLNYDSEDMFFPGDELIAWARLRRLSSFKNPLVPDPGLRFARSGIYFSGSQVEEIPIFRVNRLRHFILQGLYRYRTRVQEELDRSGTRSGYLLSAMLLGDRDAVPEKIMKLFQMTNSIHLLIISGFNLSMVAAFIFFIILGFFRMQPWILKRWAPYPLAAVLTAIPITFYAILTGLEVPAFRALIMVWLLLLAVALRKTRDLLNALGLAALIILLINPSSLLDASFQLSFLAVFVLIPYSPALWNILGGKRLVEEADLAREEKGLLIPKLRLAWLKLVIYFYGLLLATVLIQVFLAPLNAYYFSQFSFSGPFCNLLLVPICGLWVYPLGIAGMVFTEFWPGLADQLFLAAGLGAWLMEKIAWSFSSLPHFNILVRAPFSTEMLGWFAFLFGLLELARMFSRKENPRTGIMIKFFWPALLIVAGAVLSLQGYHELARSRVAPDEARISMLDVGLGQSLLIELPGEKRILIDGGGRLGAINLGQAIVSRFLLAHGIHELDMVVLTHPETDHSAGPEYILDRFDVKEFWLPQRLNKIS
jgi:competence protein ComEC